jgi:hypothetical protein
MMTSKEILAYVRASPFRPFQIHMASGRTFEIRHPEMVDAGRTGLVVRSLLCDEPEAHDQGDAVSRMLIEPIFHLDASVSQR